MTGNVVLLAFGATGAQGLPVLAPTVSLLVFLAGAQVPAPVRRRWVTTTLLVAVAGVVAVGLPVDAGGARRYVVIGLLAAGLGCRTRPCAAWQFPMSPRPCSP